MSVITRLLNGLNLTRDVGIQDIPSYLATPGVANGEGGECLVSGSGAGGSVADGLVFISVTRTTVTPNETFLIPVIITGATSLDISGDGYVIISVDQTKINDGSANSSDGSGIATLEKVTSLPSGNYIELATVSSGTPTDTRLWSRQSDESQPDTVHYGNSSGTPNAYAITVNGVEAYIDGQEFSVKADSANTGPITVNANSLGAKSVRKNNSAVMVSGDIPDNFVFDIKYNSDNDWFQLMSPVGQNPTTLVKASQSEAEAKTDDDKYITSLKGRGAAGTASTETAGESVDGTTTPQVVHISDGTNGRTAGRYYKSDADDLTNAANKFDGFVKGDKAVTETDLLINSGIVDGFTGLTVGAIYYASATAGAITTTYTGLKVGIAISATRILIDKDNTSYISTVAISGGGNVTVPAGANKAIVDMEAQMITTNLRGEITLARIGRTAGTIKGGGDGSESGTMAASWSGSTISFTGGGNDITTGEISGNVYFYKE